MEDKPKPKVKAKITCTFYEKELIPTIAIMGNLDPKDLCVVRAQLGVAYAKRMFEIGEELKRKVANTKEK